MFYKYFLLAYWFIFSFPNYIFGRADVFNFDSAYSFFSSVDCAFGFISEKFLTKLRITKIFSCFLQKFLVF